MLILLLCHLLLVLIIGWHHALRRTDWVHRLSVTTLTRVTIGLSIHGLHHRDHARRRWCSVVRDGHPLPLCWVNSLRRKRRVCRNRDILSLLYGIKATIAII